MTTDLLTQSPNIDTTYMGVVALMEDIFKLTPQRAAEAAVVTLRLAYLHGGAEAILAGKRVVLQAAQKSGKMHEVVSFYTMLPDGLVGNEDAFYAPSCMPTNEQLAGARAQATRMLEEIERDPKYPHVPVYAMTSKGLQKILDMVQTIRKPNLQGLLAQMESEIVAPRQVTIYINTSPSSPVALALFAQAKATNFREGKFYFKFAQA